jgi:hypothetical protein
MQQGAVMESLGSSSPRDPIGRYCTSYESIYIVCERTCSCSCLSVYRYTYNFQNV